MKYQIRQNVFETNSSSVHTLCISKKLCKPNLRICDDGYVHLNLTTYYGKDEKDYTSQLQKLVYVVTWMYIYYGCEKEELYDGYIWKDFIKEFCHYIIEQTGQTCYGIIIDKIIGDSSYDYLDHQNIPYGSYDDSNCIVSLYNPDELMNFIFNKNLWLHTDCD